MLTEAHYQLVLNFFFFILQDEVAAVTASLEAIRKIKKEIHEAPEKLNNTLIIRIVNSTLEDKSYRKRVLLKSLTPKSTWIRANPEALITWREFIRQGEPSFAAVLIYHYILGFSVKDISQGLDVPEGTIYFRLARALESFSNIPVHTPLVKS